MVWLPYLDLIGILHFESTLEQQDTSIVITECHFFPLKVTAGHQQWHNVLYSRKR